MRPLQSPELCPCDLILLAGRKVRAWSDYIRNRPVQSTLGKSKEWRRERRQTGLPSQALRMFRMPSGDRSGLDGRWVEGQAARHRCPLVHLETALSSE